MSDVEAQEHFDNFFEEVFTELEDKVNEQCPPFQPSVVFSLFHKRLFSKTELIIIKRSECGQEYFQTVRQFKFCDVW